MRLVILVRSPWRPHPESYKILDKPAYRQAGQDDEMEDKMITVQTHNLGETQTLGESMGRQLKGDETFALVSPLGGGKTSFTQGLAKGIGAKARVTSPTFVLEKIYTGDKLVLHHFDTYRIEVGDIESTGLLDILGETVVVVEWADKIKPLLPLDAIWVTIKIGKGDERMFEFIYPESRAYIFKVVPPSCV